MCSLTGEENIQPYQLKKLFSISFKIHSNLLVVRTPAEKKMARDSLGEAFKFHL